ncbi:MAG: RNA-directed DNA polymerase [Sedimenticola sp.]
MPKSHRLQLQTIADWDNVAWAMGRACRGKRRNPAVVGMLARADEAIGAISAALGVGHLPVGHLRAFEIHDPKRRLIHAAPLADRVAHHALVRHLEPTLERALLPSVFACRVGKGVHAAIHHAQRQARRFPWVMHLDIAHYFPNIDHATLRAQLRRRFRGDGLGLIDSVIDAHQGAEGRGLPIGALTSQHFANHYLNLADRWLLAQPEVRAHCRYMDDFLVWSDDKVALKALRDRFIAFLADELVLAAKPPLIQRSEQGVLFCGIHIKPRSLRASQRRRRRFRHSLDHWQGEWLAGRIGDLALQRAHDSARAILLPADDRIWRKQCVNLGGHFDV